ncbi:MAG: alpha/beta hydrolase [Acetobacter sp.]|nr:alpha/beta hydrolase [Acetobacter sp.]
MKRLLMVIALVIGMFWNILAWAAETLSYIPENPEYALVMIHGYGQSGTKMKGMENQLKEALPHTALYFPTAPDNGPWGGYQWFVIPKIGMEMSDKALYDKMMKDALKNVKYLHNLIDEIHQIQGIPYENISVAGFSQGGLMALLTGLTNSHNLHKVVSFSGVPLLLTRDFTRNKVVAEPQILIIQGDMDTVIPATSFQMTTETLKSLGIKSELEIIRGMSHEINAQALSYFKEFMVFEEEKRPPPA